MRDDLDQLVSRDTVLDREPQVERELVGSIQRGERRDGD
jgi:hypothetical protein